MTACITVLSTPANGQDGIRYDVTYDCPPFNDAGGVSSGRKFKVLSCDGRGNCKVFIVNEYNPNGGFETDKPLSEVQYEIKRFRCAAPGGATPPVQQPTNSTPAAQTNTPATNSVACPPSDADSDGRGMAGDIRRAIRESAEYEPRPGLDGRITLTFQSFALTGTRRWVAYTDPLNARGKTMYTARATFTACTDYTTQIKFIKREIACHKDAAGKFSCSIIAAPNTNVKDKEWTVDK
jgi:hypothetical protein